MRGTHAPRPRSATAMEHAEGFLDKRVMIGQWGAGRTFAWMAFVANPHAIRRA